MSSFSRNPKLSTIQSKNKKYKFISYVKEYLINLIFSDKNDNY